MLNNYKNFIILFLSLFVVGAMYVMQLRVDESKHQLNQCQFKIEEQNNGIETMQKEFLERLKKRDIAEQNAHREAVRYQHTINDIMSSTVPKDCESAVKWAIRQGKDIK